MFSHCRPRDLVVKYLEYNYLQKFLISPMFKNYIKELIGTITVSSATCYMLISATLMLVHSKSEISSEVLLTPGLSCVLMAPEYKFFLCMEVTFMP